MPNGQGGPIMGHRKGADKVVGCDKMVRRQGICPLGGIRGGERMGKCMVLGHES